MPITQDRLIALLEIAEAQHRWRSNLAEYAKRELARATNEYYMSKNSDGLLLPIHLSNMLASLQSVVAAIIDNPPLSETALTLLIRERDHFHYRRGSNARAARSMARKRGARVELVE